MEAESSSPSSSTTTYTKGEAVAVRCNQHKWLLGEVKRVSPRGGVRVWVAEAALLVNVPQQLVSTHLLKMSSMDEALNSLPPAQSMLSTATPVDYDRLLVSCVRPAHLSHRLLYLSSGGGASRRECAICGLVLILEDEAVAPWDCSHHCHIDCIQDRPHFFSTTTCPICSRSISPSPREQPSKLHPIDEHKPSAASPTLKPALRKQSVTFHDLREKRNGESEASSSSSSSSLPSGLSPGASPSSSPTLSPSPSPKVAVSSLAERMKKFSMAAASSNGGGGRFTMASTSNGVGTKIQHAAADQQQAQWLTVIKDGHDTRETDVQQRIEHMAKAKENTFSAKAAKMKQSLT